MKTKYAVILLGLALGLVYSGCTRGQPASTSAAPETGEPRPTLTSPPTPEPIEPSPPAPPTVPPEPVSFPLAEPGPYQVGSRAATFVDEGRSGRTIRLTLYYPAVIEPTETGRLISRGAPPDMSGAPYPLVLTDPNSGDQLFKTHLASHGFVMAVVQFPDHYDNWDLGVVDHPRDILFALDRLAADPPEGLGGFIDADRTGVAGYSWGGFYSLAVSGVRIDPAHYLARCAEAPSMDPPLDAFWLDYYCSLADNWEAFVEIAGEGMTRSEDGLWQPLTDPRILAVAPLAPDGAWLYGPNGLAAADRPALIMVGTEDDISAYRMESVYIYHHLGSAGRFMISYIGEDHWMVFSPEPIARMRHFVTAFFGTYLQGREDYAAYVSEDFVNRVDDLAWGVFADP